MNTQSEFTPEDVWGAYYRKCIEELPEKTGWAMTQQLGGTRIEQELKGKG